MSKSFVCCLLAVGMSALVGGALAAVNITPPNLSGATAGTISGLSSVSSRGASQYAISLPMPPGTAGASPSLSLQYDSDLGTNESGVGWSIGGLSSITRCKRTWVTDGFLHPVDLTAQDAYCLDGQRLIKIQDIDGSVAEYRTEVESFQRIKSFGSNAANGPSSWTVESARGQIATYGGASGNSTIMAPATTANLFWLLSKSQDQYGNYVSYEYQASTGSGEHTIARIRYTGNDNTGLVAYNAVNFNYETRTDTFSGYTAGSAMQRGKRLRSIDTRVNTAADGSAGTLVRQWALAYAYSLSSGRSLVQSITDCDGGGNCLPATTFAWTTRDPAHNTFAAPGSGVWGGGQALTFGSTNTDGALTSQVGRKVLVADFNGDGKSDLLYNNADGITDWNLCLSTGAAFSCALKAGMPGVVSSSFLVGDVNGDGRADVVIPADGIGSMGDWQLCQSTGTTFNCGAFALNVPSKGRNPNNYIVGDFNGDGRADMLVLGTSDASTYLCLSNGAGFNACSQYSAWAALHFEDSPDSRVDRVFRLSGDFTGDGRVGFLQTQRLISGTSSKYPKFYDQTYVAVWVAGATGFEMKGQNTAWGGMGMPPPGLSIVGDLNGDGYPDLIYYGRAYDASNVQHLYSTTCRFTGKLFPCTSVDETGNSFLASTVDLNRYDGTDVTTGSASNGFIRYTSTGVPLSYTAWTTATGGAAYAGSVIGDFNGDGLPDFAGYDSSTGQWTVNLVGSGSFPDRLQTVTDGYGLVTSYQYKALSSPSAPVYTPGSLPAYPKQNSRASAPVVSKMSVSAVSGLTPGATLDTSYSYKGLRADLLGRGSLGFEQVTSVESATNVSTVTTYSQDFPTIGRPVHVTKTAANSVVLSDQTSVWQTLQTYPGVQTSYVRQSAAFGKELDGSALPTRYTQVGTQSSTTDGIDSFANVTASTETVVDGNDTFVSTANKTIDNRTGASWLLGLVTDTVITKSAPGAANVTREVAATFNDKGALATSTVQPGSPNLSMLTTYIPDPSYGVINKVTQSWTDPLTGGAMSRDVSTNTYDPRKRWPLIIANALSQSQSFTYDDGTGQPLSNTDINQLTTTRQYDGWGRKTRETRPDTTYSTWAYKSCINTCGSGNTAVSVKVEQHWAVVGGAPEQTVVPREEFLDGRGRVVLTRSWDYAGTPVYADSIYDARGRLDRSSAPQTATQRSAGTYGWTYRVNDDLGRPFQLKTTNADNTGVDITLIAYSGLSTTTTDANAHSRTEVLNGLGKIKRVVDALGNIVTYTYDPFGNLALTQDPAGNQISVVYDALGRKFGQIDPDLGTWAYVVDAAGRLRRQTDAKAQVTIMVYDPLDRMTQRLEPDLDSRWVYDTAVNGVGDLAEVFTWVAATSTKDYRRVYAYDALNRETQNTTTLDWDYSILTTYNNYGQVATTTHRRNAIGATNTTAQVVVALAYNNQGAVSQVQRDGVTVWTLNAQDARGQTTLQTLGNGLKVAHGYNAYTGRLETIKSGTDNGAGGVTPTVQADAYSYDAVGNVMSVQQWANNAGALMNEAFTFDALNRLRTTQVAGFAQETIGIDALGNITSKTGVGSYYYPAAGTSGPHLIGSITGTVAGLVNPTYAYDGNGNIVTGLNRYYTWSNANLPVTIDRLTSGSPVSANLRYAFNYGPERQRNRQIIQAMSGTTPGAAQTIMWTAAGMEKEIDFASGMTKLRTYLPLGLGYTEELLPGTSVAPTATAARAERYFHNDHLGSLNVVTDGTGVVLQRMGFDGWGRRRGADGTEMPWSVLGSAATANTQDKRGFTGQEQLDDLGLVHLNGRVYDPMTGRMTSADPTIPNPYDLQSMNRASYVNNNPLGYTDPTGFAGVGASLERASASLPPDQESKIHNSGGILGTGAGVSVVYFSTSAPQASTTATDGKTVAKLASTLATAIRTGATEIAVTGAELVLLKATIGLGLVTFGDTGDHHEDARMAARRAEADAYFKAQAALAATGVKSEPKKDGEGSSTEEVAGSSGGPTAGQPVTQGDRQRILGRDRNANGNWTCWRCGWESGDASDFDIGHKNVPRSKGGNKTDDNLACEGQACNRSAGNRGQVKPGSDCVSKSCKP